ncbi:Interactor of constitutive active ROPs 3 [Raphanus sativus]|nr:Interactor of constitutive active ROPs 3 [Raphanus sativus]
MQTQRARNGSPDVPKKLSPRADRPLKLAAPEPDSSSSPISANNRTPKDKSPKFSDRKLPRSHVYEKKKPSRITEHEALVSQLQEELTEDLTKAKHQVTVSETSKKQTKQEAEESRKLLQEFSFKLRETRNQALEEETDKTFHRSVSEEGDLDFAAVVQEIRQLKLQIEKVASSEAGYVKQAELRNSEIHLLRENLMDTLFLVENFSNQLKDCEVTDAETKALATETLRQMENAKKAVEELKSDGTKAVESYRKMAVELEQSKARMVWLGGLVTKLLVKLGESNEMKEEVSSLRCEVERLRAALEASGEKDQEGNVEASSRLRIQAELQSELKTAKSKIVKLKAMLVAKNTELRFMSEETDAEAELNQLREVIEKIKVDLMDKETQLQIVSDENETLKSDIHKRETDVQDALMKLEIAKEEADKSSKRAVSVTEQLEATQESYSEMKTELMKLNVQSNIWRIAAEEATTMRSAGNNNNQTNSPCSEGTDDEVQRKKRGISLRRLVFSGRTRRDSGD